MYIFVHILYMKNISLLLKTQQTVFTLHELELLLWYTKKESLRKYLSRNAKSGIIQNVWYWLRALPHYNPYEVGCKHQKHSYISLSTVLYKKWVIFQTQNNQYYLINNKTLTYESDGNTYMYHTIKNSILYSQKWIQQKAGYSIATVERALCDRAYLFKTGSVDSPESIQKELLKEILQLYPRYVHTLLESFTL